MGPPRATVGNTGRGFALGSTGLRTSPWSLMSLSVPEKTMWSGLIFVRTTISEETP